MKLAPGLYEQVLTQALAHLRDDPASEQLGLVEAADAAPDLLARHVFEAAQRALENVKGADRVERQLALANRVLAVLAEQQPDVVEVGDALTDRVLLALRAQAGLGTGALPRPGIALRHSDLIVNGPRDLRVGREIARELPSADRVDLLMSFVKWSGFVELKDALTAFRRDRDRPMRLLTTTYLGASEIEAVQAFADLGAEVRVSYDDRRTRLHAKAWLFHRDSGFSTAIVGSSNLSSAALRDGCEWNVRVSQRDNAGLWAKLRTTFDQYWEDPSFEPFAAARFEQATRPRTDAGRDALARLLELRPLPHQLAVLDALAAERAAGHSRNLVVAATGTGKTVIAALDYARLPGRPRLLFVAHRDRILDQALATFRVALKDGNFGEKHTGASKPVVGAHVFASIQALHEERLAALPPDAYDVVIVDEFHHAAAKTYRALLEHLRPRVLLGLTATPERADGRSVLEWFDGRVAAESRLWDALDQDLLCPFVYFGIHDGTDLSQIEFRSGRYDVASLERLYTADEHRAKAVLRGLMDKVRAPREMRALGFCVSVMHAEYMREFFVRHGLRAEVVLGTTPPDVRDARVAALERGELCCLFTVDVFNEGVDIPRVDTVLMLRPTESATVFLQQLGRGLRLHPEKACVTVLDFVGSAHRDFRWDLRFKAMTGGGTRKEVERAAEEGFPRLPSGCAIVLDRATQQSVLDNLRRATRRWAALADDLGPDTTLAEFLRRTELDPRELYAPHKTFTELRAVRGFAAAPEGTTAQALHRALHVDDEPRLAAFRALVAGERAADPADPYARMLFAVLGQEDRPLADLGAALHELRTQPELLDEVRQLFGVLDDRRRGWTVPLDGLPLQVHAHYTRAEISAALGMVTESGKLLATQAGVYRAEQQRCDVLFVTLEKNERDFTPTTLYADYPISPTMFHWQSQGPTREDSDTGRRYRVPPPGWRILLFARRTKRDERGVTCPFLCLGPVSYVSHEGERPMSIIWRLAHPMPGGWFQEVKIAAG